MENGQPIPDFTFVQIWGSEHPDDIGNFLTNLIADQNGEFTWNAPSGERWRYYFIHPYPVENFSSYSVSTVVPGHDGELWNGEWVRYAIYSLGDGIYDGSIFTMRSGPTPTPTETPTPTTTPTSTPTPIPTESPTPTSTPTPTESPTPSPTPTKTPTTIPPAEIFPSPLSSTRSMGDGAFLQDVDIERSTDVAAFEFVLHFDPAILQAKSASIGPFLAVPGCTVLPVSPVIDNDAGTVKYGAASFGSCGASGSGALAHIEFEPIAIGTSPLTLTDTQLGDPLGNGLAHTVENGQVTIVQ